MQAMDWNSIVKKYFVELMDVVRGGLNLAGEQVPLYLKELITYEFWHCFLWGSFYLVGMILTACLSKRFHTNLVKDWDNDSTGPMWLFALAFALIASIGFAINSAQEFDSAIKAKVAPRVIVVEKIQALIKDTQPVSKE